MSILNKSYDSLDEHEHERRRRSRWRDNRKSRREATLLLALIFFSLLFSSRLLFSSSSRLDLLLIIFNFLNDRPSITKRYGRLFHTSRGAGMRPSHVGVAKKQTLFQEPTEI